MSDKKYYEVRIEADDASLYHWAIYESIRTNLPENDGAMKLLCRGEDGISFFEVEQEADYIQSQLPCRELKDD